MNLFAKSKNAKGEQLLIRDHLRSVAELAGRFGAAFGCEDEARLAGQFHDFGKYSDSFGDVLAGRQTGIDHAICGAAFLNRIAGGKQKYHPVIEAINAHHAGLTEYSLLKQKLLKIVQTEGEQEGNDGKRAALTGLKQYLEASAAFRSDFPSFSLQKLARYDGTVLEQMLYTRMLFSCLVDADYTTSACDDDDEYLKKSENNDFNPKELLNNLYRHRAEIKQKSKADTKLNRYRDMLFERCGAMGAEPEGLFTLTAPTGTGKTLALLHFALRHCVAHGKRRIILVLPFLTLAEQTEREYRKLISSVLVDHSQSNLPEEGRVLAERWSAPVIITTSVRFFETLFARRPTDCRKLHNIADSVVLFDEAQSLPPDVTAATLQAVNALCQRYRCTMVFSTATQPDFSAIKGVEWLPREIVPDNEEMYRALVRVDVQWRTDYETPLEQIADEMAQQNSVCAIVNLRRHARVLAKRLSDLCPDDEVFYLTTDLCPAHRTQVVEAIRTRLSNRLPCRVVATQCIEAGVDLDFGMMYRALAPLDSIIQAAGRCNRNGSPERGTVVVFRPEDNRMPYPDIWYANAAQRVLEMQPPFSIHDPANIRRYYQALFSDAKDKESLCKALECGSYADVAAAYRLIENEGTRVVVPYSGENDRFEQVAVMLHSDGLTLAAMKLAAPITVTCFDREIEKYAERIPFANIRHAEQDSRFYLLRPQYDKCYTDTMGLQLGTEELNGMF